MATRTATTTTTARTSRAPKVAFAWGVASATLAACAPEQATMRASGGSSAGARADAAAAAPGGSAPAGSAPAGSGSAGAAEGALPALRPPATPRLPAQKVPLPVVFLTASMPLVTYAADKVPGAIRVVDDHDGTLVGIEARPASLQMPIGIKYRGSSSQGMPQKSFSIELRGADGTPARAPLLGLPAESDFALVACYADKICLRNALAYAMGRALGRWNPGLLFVEVYLDGKYNGLYQLVESIKLGKSRIDEPDPAAAGDGPELTGTYVIRREAGGKASPAARPPRDFVSPTRPATHGGHPIVYTFHEPHEKRISAAQADYIKRHMADFEAMMLGPAWSDPAQGYPAWIDVESWIDFALLSEVSGNIDAYWKSLYIIKPRDVGRVRGKLVMSPLWDFNFAFGNADYRDGWRVDNWIAAMNRFRGECTDFVPLPPACMGNRSHCTNPAFQQAGCWNAPYLPFYWDRLWDDVDFQDALKCRWRGLRRDPDGPFSFEFLEARVRAFAEAVKDAQVRQLARWPELRRKVWPNPCEPVRDHGLVTDRYSDRFRQPGLPHPACAPPSAPAAEFMKYETAWFLEWTRARIAWLDAHLPGVCGPL